MSVMIDPSVPALSPLVDASEIQWSSSPVPESAPITRPVYYGTLSQTEILDYVVSLQDDVAIYRTLVQRTLAELVETQKALRNARLKIRDLESR